MPTATLFDRSILLGKTSMTYVPSGIPEPETLSCFSIPEDLITSSG